MSGTSTTSKRPSRASFSNSASTSAPDATLDRTVPRTLYPASRKDAAICGARRVNRVSVVLYLLISARHVGGESRRGSAYLRGYEAADASDEHGALSLMVYNAGRRRKVGRLAGKVGSRLVGRQVVLRR